MGRSPISDTRWFRLSRRELMVLAIGVGAALGVVALTRAADLLWGGRRVEVTSVGDAPRAVRLNVNTAREYELQMLPGIGPVTARAIVEHRQRNGPFGSLDELRRVRGVGPRTVEEIRPHAMCAPAQTAEPVEGG